MAIETEKIMKMKMIFPVMVLVISGGIVWIALHHSSRAKRDGIPANAKRSIILVRCTRGFVKASPAHAPFAA